MGNNNMQKAILILLVAAVFPGQGQAQIEKPVTFQRDSLQLVGILHLPESLNEKVPAVLMLHGFTGHKAETHFIYTRTARHFAARGVAALRFDFAGSGDSQGEFADMTILTELADARNALAFLRQQNKIDAEKIGLLGFSMGGCVAALLAGENPELQALVLWAPVAYPAERFSRFAKDREWKSFRGGRVFDLGGFYLGEAFVEILPQLVPLEAVANFSAPALILHGTADQSVPLTSGQAYADVLQENNTASKLITIENAGHTFASMEFTDRVIQLTAEWFVRHLAGE